jgi:hypothetical protein
MCAAAYENEKENNMRKAHSILPFILIIAFNLIIMLIRKQRCHEG